MLHVKYEIKLFLFFNTENSKIQNGQFVNLIIRTIVLMVKTFIEVEKFNF